MFAEVYFLIVPYERLYKTATFTEPGRPFNSERWKHGYWKS